MQARYIVSVALDVDRLTLGEWHWLLSRRIHGLPGVACRLRLVFLILCALMNNGENEVYCWGNNEMGHWEQQEIRGSSLR